MIWNRLHAPPIRILLILHIVRIKGLAYEIQDKAVPFHICGTREQIFQNRLTQFPIVIFLKFLEAILRGIQRINRPMRHAAAAKLLNDADELTIGHFQIRVGIPRPLSLRKEGTDAGLKTRDHIPIDGPRLKDILPPILPVH